MKKVLKIAVIVLLVVAAIIAVYRFAFRKSIPDAPAPEQVLAILQQNDCFVCHAQEPQLPFYAHFPIIGPMMEKHCTHAVAFTDLAAGLSNMDSVSEVTLSMLDHSVTYGTMPLHSYRLIHWGTGFNKKEKSILSAWIRERRGYDEPVCPIPDQMACDSAKANLGERLFNDKRISLDGTLNCASCHILEEGGADAGERVSEGINGLLGGINAPTVYNSVFHIRQFWNGRAADLREQAEGPATNPVEMGDQTWDQIVERLRTDKALVKEFEALYPGQGLTRWTVTNAIAEFETTLITPNCRFDQYLKGDKSALTAEEQQGYEAFKENACATCHTGVALGGKSFERLDIFGDYFADRNPEIKYNSDDEGLKGFSKKETDLHKYKVPTLRNLELTAPYLHDGTCPTIEDAVRAMGKYELGKNLSDEQVKVLSAFLRTLTGQNSHLRPEAKAATNQK